MFHIFQRKDPDSATFTENLIAENYGDIYKYCYRLLKDKILAEDITQDVFLKFMNSMERYHEYGKMKNYLYVIAGNAVRDYLKKASTVYETATDIQEEAFRKNASSLRGNQGNPAVSYGTASHGVKEIDGLLDRIVVMEALDALEPEERELIILRYYQEMRLKDIAAVMEMPVSTARYKLKQAEKILREKLMG